MGPFFPFFLIVSVGLFSAALLRKLHFPWVVALILGGILIGPQGLHLLTPDSTTEFIGQLGLTFLMFMAGLETKLSSFKESSRDLFLLAFINGFIPLLLGLGIGYYLGYNLTTMFLIGTVFVSSSIAVVVPTLEANHMFDLKIGRAVMTTSILQDVASLLLLSVLLQNISPISNIPLFVLYPLLTVIIMALLYALPRLEKFLTSLKDKEDLFQEELRSVLLILVGTVIIFELLGLHSIIAGFFVGLVLSDKVTDEVLIGKIRAISYGIFIPTFFVLIGLNTNIKVIFEAEAAFFIILLVVVGSIASKFFSGILGAKMVGFNNEQAVFFGATSIPQLSTTLAVSYTANNLGLISNSLNTAFVVLSIVSTIIGPILMSSIDRKVLSSGFFEKVSLKLGRKDQQVNT